MVAAAIIGKWSGDICGRTAKRHTLIRIAVVGVCDIQGLSRPDSPRNYSLGARVGGEIAYGVEQGTSQLGSIATTPEPPVQLASQTYRNYAVDADQRSGGR